MAGLLDFVGGLVGPVVDYFGNKSLQDTQNKQNLDLFHETQAYNTPEAQMGRLKDAGLNPNLVYGHGSVANTSAPAPTMGRTSVNVGSLPSYTQVENLDAQNANIRAQNDVIKAQAVGQNLDNVAKAREVKILSDSDKSGYMVSKDDAPGVRLILKGLNSSVLQDHVQSIKDWWGESTSKVGDIINNIGDWERKVMPWLPKRQ
nr:MAG: DNA pilot protein [Microviridae sp.]